MTIVYKLTDSKGQSYGGMQWGENITHEATGPGQMFCSADLIHYYGHPLLAVLLDPIHSTFGPGALLWEAEIPEGSGLSNYGLKGGAKQLTTLRQIPLPVVSIPQRVRFGILCAKAVYRDKAWNSWADKWLSGTNRSARAAFAAARAAFAAEQEALVAWGAALAAGRAALVAGGAALAPAAEAAAEWRAFAAERGVSGGERAALVAWGAALAASRAAWGAALDLQALASQSLTEEAQP